MLFKGATFWIKDSSKKNVLYMLLYLSSLWAMPYWQSRSLTLSNSPTIISWSSTLWILPKYKVNLITWRCLTNVASNSNYIQYCEYTILKTSMIPWVWLISNFWTKAFIAPIKTKITMDLLLAWKWKKKSRNWKKNWVQRAKRKESCRAYFCISSSPLIQQQQKHPPLP